MEGSTGLSALCRICGTGFSSYLFPFGFFARVGGGDDKGRCWGGEEREVREGGLAGAGLFLWKELGHDLKIP